MSADERQLIKSTATVTPLLEEDWRARAGQWWRKGIERISSINRRYFQIGEKAAEAPELAWKAAQGLATEKHAKAIADYSKAENDLIEAELKRRTLVSKTRQEEADASRKETEARIARITELKARLELYDRLKGLGVAIDIFSDDLHVYPASETSNDIRSKILEPEEQTLLKAESSIYSIKIEQTK
jgi:hypothetical protein